MATKPAPKKPAKPPVKPAQMNPSNPPLTPAQKKAAAAAAQQKTGSVKPATPKKK